MMIILWFIRTGPEAWRREFWLDKPCEWGFGKWPGPILSSNAESIAHGLQYCNMKRNSCIVATCFMPEAARCHHGFPGLCLQVFSPVKSWGSVWGVPVNIPAVTVAFVARNATAGVSRFRVAACCMTKRLQHLRIMAQALHFPLRVFPFWPVSRNSQGTGPAVSNRD